MKPQEIPIVNKAERKFAEWLNSHHIKWRYQHRVFTFGHPPINYSPDFHLTVQNVYVEVIGSRQRLHQAKRKYAAFLQAFPSINWKMVRPDGTEIPYHIVNGELRHKTLQVVKWSKVNGQYTPRSLRAIPVRGTTAYKIKQLALRNGRFVYQMVDEILERYVKTLPVK